MHIQSLIYGGVVYFSWVPAFAIWGWNRLRGRGRNGVTFVGAGALVQILALLFHSAESARLAGASDALYSWIAPLLLSCVGGVLLLTGVILSWGKLEPTHGGDVNVIHLDDMNIVRIDCSKITDSETFHDVFTAAMGFPDFYGRNMNAWTDCMTSLDEPDHGLTNVHVPKGEMLTLSLDNIDAMISVDANLYGVLVDSVAFVNHRRLEDGDAPVLALSYWADPSRNR